MILTLFSENAATEMLLFTCPVKTKESYINFSLYIEPMQHFQRCIFSRNIKNKWADITHHDKTKVADGDIPINVDRINIFQRDAVLVHAVLLVFYLYLTHQNQALSFKVVF